MRQLSQFESICSGMPHILDYCGTISLVNISRVSRLFNHTTTPIIRQKLQQFPIVVIVNDIVIDCKTSLNYSIPTNKLSVKTNFKYPYKISVDPSFNNTMFRIQTPFDIWGIDTNIGDYMNYVFNHHYESDTQVDAVDVRSGLYSPMPSQHINVPGRNIFYYDVRVKYISLRLIFECEYEYPYIPTYDITSVNITGFELSYERVISNRELYLQTLFLIPTLLVFSVLCGPIIAIIITTIIYKCYIVMSIHYDSMYREKRLQDW